MPGVVATDNSIIVNGASPVVVINGVKQHIPISQLITYLSTVPATNTETIAINTNQLAENKLGSEEVTISIESKKKALDGYQLTNSTYGSYSEKAHLSMAIIRMLYLSMAIYQVMFLLVSTTVLSIIDLRKMTMMEVNFLVIID